MTKSLHRHYRRFREKMTEETGPQMFHENRYWRRRCDVQRKSVPQSGSSERKSSIADGWKTVASDNKRWCRSRCRVEITNITNIPSHRKSGCRRRRRKDHMLRRSTHQTAAPCPDRCTQSPGTESDAGRLEAGWCHRSRQTPSCRSRQRIRPPDTHQQRLRQSSLGTTCHIHTVTECSRSPNNLWKKKDDNCRPPT